MSRFVDCLPAFLAVLVVTPLLARFAPRLGLLDRPTARSTHAHPTARVGGLAVLLGLVAGLGWAWGRGHAALDDAAPWVPYLAGATAYVAIGLVDDRWRLGAATKFAAQVSAAVLAVALGLRWGGAAHGAFGALSFGPLTPALTVLWIVAVATVVNFMDGLDLITAAGATVMLGAAAGGGAGPGQGLLYALALAALLGFVPWNVAPARAFPGDAGTHLLGFLVASVACGTSAGAPPALALPWVLASAPLLPAVLDVACGLLGKARRGIAPWVAHNDHLSQRLTKAGRSHAAVALRYGLLTLTALLLVARIAPLAGLGTCLGLAALVLAGHVGGGLWTTRGVPWGKRAPAPRE